MVEVTNIIDAIRGFAVKGRERIGCVGIGARHE